MAKRAKTPETAPRLPSVRSAAAVLYCRVSAVESQSDSDVSLDAQERQLRAAAAAHGITEMRVVSERHTGSKRLPELSTAIEDLNAGRASVLLVSKIDRLSRSGAADVLRIADLAAKHGWRLIVLDMNLDTGTVVGRLVLTILAGVAEMESGRRSERMREYHAQKRVNGSVCGVTYGLRTTATADEMAVIAAGRASGISWKTLADRLTASSTTGRTWYPTTVRHTYASMTREEMAA